MRYLIYNLLFHFYFFITLPFYVIKFFTSTKYRGGLRERFGFVREERQGKKILVHAVSVGEFLASLPLIRILKKEFPDYKVVVSTTTNTGNRIAKREIGQECAVVYFPLDFGWAVNKFFNRISPSLSILVETELWPNFLRRAEKDNIPVVVVNGRISGHSFKNYSLLKGFFKHMCKSVYFWGMQFEGDRERIINLGIEPYNVYITGSMKFDSAIQRAPEREEIDRIKKEWGRTSGLLVLVGGSTHRGEEKILLGIYNELRQKFSGLVLILAPRHPERAGELEMLVSGYGFKYILKSACNQGNMELSQYEVVVVDTLGELVSVYSLADVVFIGKSIIMGGGQNPLEPCALGKAVVCGPYMQNFKEITDWLVSNKGMVQAGNDIELRDKIKDLLSDSIKREELGKRAVRLVRSTSGASLRNMELVRKALNH